MTKFVKLFVKLSIIKIEISSNSNPLETRTVHL